jgi:hypothetical protein
VGRGRNERLRVPGPAVLLLLGCACAELLAIAGCSSRSVSAADAAPEADGPTDHRAGASDAAATDLWSDAAACGQTIDEFCQSDAASCHSIAGDVSKDWIDARQEALRNCPYASHVYVQECRGYGLVTVGGVDTATYFYYDLSTSTLRRIVYSANGSTQCLAGVPLGPSDCLAGGPPVSVCADDDGPG